MSNRNDTYKAVEYILKNINGLTNKIKEFRVYLNIYKDQKERFRDEIGRINYDIKKCEFPINLIKRSISLLDSRQQQVIIEHYFDNITIKKLSISLRCNKETVRRVNENAISVLADVLDDCILDINDVINKYITKSRKVNYFQYSLDNKIIKIWSSVEEFVSEGYKKAGVYDCCTGRIRTYKGCKWSRYPL